MDHISREVSSPVQRSSSARQPIPSHRPDPLRRTTTNRSSTAIPALSRVSTPTYITPTPAVRIRRLPSSPSVPQLRVEGQPSEATNDQEQTGRRRSTSAPGQRPHTWAAPPPELGRGRTPQPLTSVAEEEKYEPASQRLQVPQSSTRPARSGSNASARYRRRAGSSASSHRSDQSQDYDDQVVDLLDVIDPEVSTLTTLNNVQNSLFVPYLGRYFNRQPTYDLSRPTTRASNRERPTSEAESHIPLEPIPSSHAPLDVVKTRDDFDQATAEPTLRRVNTLTSVLSTTSDKYAVLPHGTVLDGWSDEDKAELNDYVRHLLHSRRAKFKRRMRAFGKFVRKPIGFLITLYAFLLTFWGAAWVIFLIGWIYTGSSDRQAYFVEICDQILTALFCVVGIGLSPFRAVDTYHMIYIAHYHFLTWRLRRKEGLPDLHDPNDLPEPSADVELAPASSLETVVLTLEQQEKLIYHQTKFSKSHTFYKPHETYTHRAFSLRLLMAVVILLDCHSLFQMALGGTTWGIYYRRRPKALTAIILSCSISCNISAGITISVGDKRSRKKEIVEQIFRQALTEEAMEKLKKEKGLEASKDTTKEGLRRTADGAMVREKLTSNGLGIGASGFDRS